MHARNVAPMCLTGLAIAAAGCGGGGGGGSTGGSTQQSTGAKVGAPGAKVTFVKPKDGATTPSTVTAVVKVTGFKISPATVGKAAKQGQGHLHFSMDGGKYDFPKYSGANGQLAKKLGVAGKYSPAVKPTITYKGLPAGKHKLEVYLANNDHTNTGVEGETKFTVK